MSNPNTFITNYLTNINNLISAIEQARYLNEQLTADPTIITRYFAQTPVPRADIVAVDVTNAEAALVQVIFAYDSGAPTQKSYLFKVLP